MTCLHGELVAKEAPPLPGEGAVVYLNQIGPLTVIARLAYGAQLATVWSWQAGDEEWTRNYAC